MKFMGKWILWCPLADGYLGPGWYWADPDTSHVRLIAAHPVDIKDAVYNLYAGPHEGELPVQNNSVAAGLSGGGQKISDAWVQCNPGQKQDLAVILTANPASASPITMKANGQCGNLFCNSTPLYLNMYFYGLCEVVLGFPGGTSSPDLAITVKTQPLETYRQSKSAANADFSTIDFRGIDLSGIDFTGADFSGAYLDGQTTLGVGILLRRVTFSGAHLEGVQFGGCDLSGAGFTNTSLAGIHFDAQTKLAGAKFIKVDLSNLHFSGFDLAGADFTGAKLNLFDVQGAKLSGAIMPNFDLAQLAPSSFTNPPALAGTSTLLTNLTGSKIPFALIGSDWQWIDLRNATIPDLPQSITRLQASGAKLPGLNKNILSGYSLRDAVFDNAVLDGVGLSGADLTGASLIETSLHGTTLTNATLVRAQMAGAQLGALSHLFALPLSAEPALNAGQVAAIAPGFAKQGITLSSTATLSTLAANRVWELNDAGDKVTYAIRLETQSGGTQILSVYGPAVAASLVDAYMPDAVLTGANLYGVLASGAQFYGSKARIDGSAILERVEFNGANLSNLNLTQANLYGANLSGAQLFNARFNKADLSPSADGVAANLSQANLQGADFTDALLYGANLANAAVAVEAPTKGNPKQGGVWLFSLPYAGDKTTLQQYSAELNAAATRFSLNPDGDAATLQKYVTALKTNDLAPLKLAFLKQQPPIPLSANAQIETVEAGTVWQIVDGTSTYTLWEGLDQNGNTELYAAPSMTSTRAAFQQNDLTLRWQASAAVDTAGQQWLVDNDSENPQNFSTGYVKFILKLNGGALEVYGTAVRIERLGDDHKLQMDTETCNVTVLAAGNMNGETVCPNGAKLSTNQAQGGKSWDVNWLRASAPPAPPTCVPTDYSWCPQAQSKVSASAPRKGPRTLTKRDDR